MLISACQKQQEPEPSPPDPISIRSADLSFFPEIRKYQIPFKNADGVEEDLLSTFRQNGGNMVRLRLWKDPAGVHSGWDEVRGFANELKSQGFGVWLSVHYSDTWADPANQTTPAAWQGLEIDKLRDSIFHYTSRIVKDINPDIIQIGNEINHGFLWPVGSINNPDNFRLLLQSSCEAVRAENPETRIMLHFAGIQGSSWFFDRMSGLDYDLIGISYYPRWHGKAIHSLGDSLSVLNDRFGKETLIAETAYPFTLDWADMTHNAIGLPDQLIDGYDATPEGQLKFMESIRSEVNRANACLGLSYWGGEFVAFKGPQSTSGSSWENQALYDFGFMALPVLTAFRE